MSDGGVVLCCSGGNFYCSHCIEFNVPETRLRLMRCRRTVRPSGEERVFAVAADFIAVALVCSWMEIELRKNTHTRNIDERNKREDRSPYYHNIHLSLRAHIFFTY